MDAKTGSIVPENQNLYFVESTYLPGIVAGEIIAAYDYARSDRRLAATASLRLRSGLYNLYFEPGWSASGVAFYRLDNAPDKLPLLAAPTPSPRPGSLCLGACGGIFADYIITVLGGKFSIKLHPVV